METQPLTGVLILYVHSTDVAVVVRLSQPFVDV